MLLAGHVTLYLVIQNRLPLLSNWSSPCWKSCGCPSLSTSSPALALSGRCLSSSGQQGPAACSWQRLSMPGDLSDSVTPGHVQYGVTQSTRTALHAEVTCSLTSYNAGIIYGMLYIYVYMLVCYNFCSKYKHTLSVLYFTAERDPSPIFSMPWYRPLGHFGSLTSLWLQHDIQLPLSFG